MTTCATYRNDFPLLKEGKCVYLDTAATAQKPQVVIDALTDFYTHHYGTVHRGVYALSRNATELYDQARLKVQHFLNAAHPEEIIYTRGTTASLNLLAQSFPFQPGDVILISEIEHHSNIVPWQMACERKGAFLRTIPVTDRGELDLEAYKELLNEDVKLVSLAHISNVLGTLHPVQTLIEWAHQVGAKVCLDGAQAAAHLPIDVRTLDVDFYAFSGHKAYGPTGVGVFYGKKELLEQMPPVEGGGDMIEHVTFEKTTYNPLPLKFEAGTPMIAEAIALGVALDYLTEVGLEAIFAHEQELLAYATQHLSTIPNLQILGTAPQKGGIITFTIEGVHPLDLATLLDCQGIAIRSGHHCSQPAMDRFSLTTAARISFGLYTTLEEIDTFLTSLRNVLNFLTPEQKIG